MAVAAAVLGLGITLSFGYAEHDPRPHEAAPRWPPPPRTCHIRAAGLQRAEPDGFDLVSAPSARAAIESVRSQVSVGGLIVPRRGAVTIVTAGAEGALQQQTMNAALTAAAQSMDRAADRLDVAPLTAGDRSGLSSLRLRPRAAPSQRDRRRQHLPARYAAAAVVACSRRGPVRAAGRLWRRPGHGHRAGALTGASGPRSALVFSAPSPSCCSSPCCKQSSACPAPPCCGHVYLRRQRRLRRASTGRLSPGRLPSGGTMAPKQCDRPRRPGRRRTPSTPTDLAHPLLVLPVAGCGPEHPGGRRPFTPLGAPSPAARKARDCTAPRPSWCTSAGGWGRDASRLDRKRPVHAPYKP